MAPARDDARWSPGARIAGSGWEPGGIRGYTGGMAKDKRKRRRGGRSSGRSRGGLLSGMRSGFKGIASTVTGAETAKRKSPWLSWVITLLLVAAAVGLLASRL